MLNRFDLEDFPGSPYARVKTLEEIDEEILDKIEIRQNSLRFQDVVKGSCISRCIFLSEISRENSKPLLYKFST